MGIYLGPPCYGYAINCHLVCLFGNTRDTSVMHEKAKFVCFNYMQPQKVQFNSVQINMKHVSYILLISYKHVICIFVLVDKMKLIFRASFLFCLHRPGSMVVVCLVPRLLDELKHNKPSKCDWNIFQVWLLLHSVNHYGWLHATVGVQLIHHVGNIGT